MRLYDYVVKDRKGIDVKLDKYKGKVLLIVNTATGCGFTPQYEGLEKLYKKYQKQGFEILDFPCNQFGNQAPGTDNEINEFCTLKYNTSFDRFKKVDVNGENEVELYTYLKSQVKDEEVSGIKNKIAMKAIEKIGSAKKDGDIKWNFTKFLVDKDGKVLKRYAPTTKPIDIEKDIESLI